MASPWVHPNSRSLAATSYLTQHANVNQHTFIFSWSFGGHSYLLLLICFLLPGVVDDFTMSYLFSGGKEVIWISSGHKHTWLLSVLSSGRWEIKRKDKLWPVQTEPAEERGGLFVYTMELLVCVLCCSNALTPPLATLVCRIIAFSDMNNSVAGCLLGLGVCSWVCVSTKCQGKISSSAGCLSKHVCSLAAVVSSLFSRLFSSVEFLMAPWDTHLSFFLSLSIFWSIRLPLSRSSSLSSQILPLSSFLLFLHPNWLANAPLTSLFQFWSTNEWFVFKAFF